MDTIVAHRRENVNIRRGFGGTVLLARRRERNPRRETRASEQSADTVRMELAEVNANRFALVTVGRMSLDDADQPRTRQLLRLEPAESNI